MADDSGVVADAGVSEGLFSGLDAVDKVSLVSGRAAEVDFVGADFFLEDLGV